LACGAPSVPCAAIGQRKVWQSCVLAYRVWSGVAFGSVNWSPVELGRSTFWNCSVGSAVVAPVPVVKLIENGTMLAPVVSFTPLLTENVYCVLGASRAVG